MNRLSTEQSPYLLQHSHNPVNWYPWNDEAFDAARAANKPVIVSIGYAACHWCHVMERESFENEETAAYMNAHFICIKVDREEHPDVDHLYMDAVQAISGSGGWPLNVFVTPERIPFYGGTYFPPQPAYNRPSWPQLLQRMNDIWTSQQPEVQAQSEQMLAYLKNASGAAFSANAAESWSMDDCRRMADTLLKTADKEWGGFGNAPKFPGTMAISFLIEHYRFTGYEPALQQALLSLDKMIAGGIYDQLGGGFARYSTDRQWLAPHFEKMLYDNALIILALCDAYAVTKNERYREVIEETITFLRRELKDPAGGYYSALDADSEGEEGKFYTWTWDEWKDALPGNNLLAENYFGVSEAGNWEGTNILHISRSAEEITTSFGVSRQDFDQEINTVKQTLLQAREKRIRPHTDDKTLLSWNALLNSALTRAGVVLEREDYLHEATAHIQWLLREMTTENGLQHTWKAGAARIPAKLDDYAYLISALLYLGSATGEHEWMEKAASLTQDVDAHFAEAGTGFFYFTSDAQQDIPVRKVDIYDGAMPSPNAVMAHNLMLLGLVLERADYIGRSEAMLRQLSGSALRYTYSFGYWAKALQQLAAGFKTAVITGAEAKEKHRELGASVAGNIFPILSLTGKKELPVQKEKQRDVETLIFVCTTHTCLPPYTAIDAVLRENQRA